MFIRFKKSGEYCGFLNNRWIFCPTFITTSVQDIRPIHDVSKGVRCERANYMFKTNLYMLHFLYSTLQWIINPRPSHAKQSSFIFCMMNITDCTLQVDYIMVLQPSTRVGYVYFLQLKNQLSSVLSFVSDCNVISCSSFHGLFILFICLNPVCFQFSLCVCWYVAYQDMTFLTIWLQWMRFLYFYPVQPKQCFPLNSLEFV